MGIIESVAKGIVISMIKEEVWNKRLYYFFFPTNNYKTRLTKIIRDTINQYERIYPFEVENDSFPFYHSQILFEHLSLFVLFKKGSLETIEGDFKMFPKMILPSKAELEEFYSIFLSKVNSDETLKFKFIEENFKSQIFEVSKTIEGVSKVVGSIKEDTTEIKKLLIGLVAEKPNLDTNQTAELDKEKTISNFILSINLVLKCIKEQNVKLTKLYIQLEETKKNIDIVIIHNLKIIRENFPHDKSEEVVRAFGQKRENFKIVTNIFACIKLISTLINKFEERVMEFPKIINEERKVYSKSLHDIFAQRDAYVVEINSGMIGINDDPFILELIHVCENHMKVVNDDKFLFGKESFFDPIEVVRKNYVHTNPLAIKLNQPVFNAMKSYERMEEERINLMKDITRLKDELQDYSHEIKKDITELQKSHNS